MLHTYLSMKFENMQRHICMPHSSYQVALIPLPFLLYYMHAFPGFLRLTFEYGAENISCAMVCRLIKVCEHIKLNVFSDADEVIYLQQQAQSSV